MTTAATINSERLVMATSIAVLSETGLSLGGLAFSE